MQADNSKNIMIDDSELYTKDKIRFKDLLDQYRSQRDYLSAGELFASQLVNADDDDLEYLFSNTVVCWACSDIAATSVDSVSDIIERIDDFVPRHLAISLIHAIMRTEASNRYTPTGVPDLLYRVSDQLQSVYQIPVTVRQKNLYKRAIASTRAELEELQRCVHSFENSTALTARQPSIRILKQMGKYRRYSLPCESEILSALNILLGNLFRNFCQSCERQEIEKSTSYAKNLREHLHQLYESHEEASQNLIWATLLSPVAAHVSHLIDRRHLLAAHRFEPRVRILRPRFKLPPRNDNEPIILRSTIHNEGDSTASSIALVSLPNSDDCSLSIVDPERHFNLSTGQQRLVKLSVIRPSQIRKFSILVRWTYKTADDRESHNDQLLEFEPQNIHPSWQTVRSDDLYPINPIRHKEQLYGRDSTLEELRRRILRRTSTFLWGQKRVGKTSVLQVLTKEVSENDDVVCVILRIGEIVYLDEGQIAHTIASALVSKLGAKTAVPDEDYFAGRLGKLIPFVSRLMSVSQSANMLVVIDEFDDLSGALYMGERGRQFVKALRSLSEIGLTFFFVGSERMDSIYNEHASDLNKWINYRLDFIDDDEDCIALITKPVKDIVEYDERASRSMIEYCGKNPFYLHLLADSILTKCIEERRTYVAESDIEYIKRDLVSSLGATNFAHLWDDIPSLNPRDRDLSSAHTCLFLTCLSFLPSGYESIDELLTIQRQLEIPHEQKLRKADFRHTEQQMLRRRVIVRRSHRSLGAMITLPIFRDWVRIKGESELLSAFRRYLGRANQIRSGAGSISSRFVDVLQRFPIAEEDLLPISQKLVWHGQQKDVAEIRRWLQQFDDITRIEVAFSVLHRLATSGFIDSGTMINSLERIRECISSIRLEIGDGVWSVQRGRNDNLCIAYVDSELKSGASVARSLAKRMRPGKSANVDEIDRWIANHMHQDPIVVIVDDFAGSGDTLCRGLDQLFSGRGARDLARMGRIVCCIQVSLAEGSERLTKRFPNLKVRAIRRLGSEVIAFDRDAGIFGNRKEREFARNMFLQIGRELWPQFPLGFRDMGALVAFHDTIPNNTLPVFWCNGNVSGQTWIPLFERVSV